MYRVAATVTVDTATSVLESGARAIASGQTEFDLDELAVIDSAAVAALLAWQRAARKGGVQLTFLNVPVNLRSLADLYGVSELLLPPSART